MQLVKLNPKLHISTSKLFEYGLILGIVALSLALRKSLFSIHSADYDVYISPWYDFIQSKGGFPALKYNFADYNVPYLYLLVAATYLPVQKIVILKAISVFFDLALAGFSYLIVKLKYEGSYLPIIAAFIILFIPTVFINSSLWGQCDSIYTAFNLGGLYFLLRKKQIWAFIFFGIAFSFKLQAIFLFPLLFVLLITGEVRLRYFWIMPLTFLALLIPAAIAGRGVKNLLSIYILQTQAKDPINPSLTYNAPNIFQWIHSTDLGPWKQTGTLLALAIVAILSFSILTSKKRITSTMMIKLAFIFVLCIPFVLPQMHERYFYMADIISIVYAFYVPRYFYLAIVVQISSLFSYAPFLFGTTVLDLRYVAFFLLFAIIVAIYDLTKELYAGPDVMSVEEQRTDKIVAVTGRASE